MVVVKYKYDGWGNHEAEVAAEGYVALAEINPFRYRGYYYDTETGLYYLQTHYYDPEVGRFISRDSIEYATPETINGLNLYAYCGHNPILNVDTYGNDWQSFLEWDWAKIGMIAVSVVEIIVGIVVIICSYGSYASIGIGLISTGIGAVVNGYLGETINKSFAAGWHGGQAAGLIATFIPGIGATIGGAVGSIVTDLFNHEAINKENAILSGLLGFAFGKLTGTFSLVIKELGKDVLGQTINGLNIFIVSVIAFVIDYFRGVRT